MANAKASDRRKIKTIKIFQSIVVIILVLFLVFDVFMTCTSITFLSNYHELIYFSLAQIILSFIYFCCSYPKLSIRFRKQKALRQLNDRFKPKFPLFTISLGEPIALQVYGILVLLSLMTSMSLVIMSVQFPEIISTTFLLASVYVLVVLVVFVLNILQQKNTTGVEKSQDFMPQKINGLIAIERTSVLKRVLQGLLLINIVICICFFDIKEQIQFLPIMYFPINLFILEANFYYFILNIAALYDGSKASEDTCIVFEEPWIRES